MTASCCHWVALAVASSIPFCHARSIAGRSPISNFPDAQGSAPDVLEAVGDACAIALDVVVGSTAAGVGASSGELHAAIAKTVTRPAHRRMAEIRKLASPPLF